jgi:hypothetical protein
MKEKATKEIVEYLGFKSFDDDWGREHLVGNDKYFFDSVSLRMFRALVSLRTRELERESK